MGYVPPDPPGYRRTIRDHWWQRGLPCLELPGPMWDTVSTNITVEPLSADRTRWSWRVDTLCNGRRNPGMYRSSTVGRPSPGSVGGRTRDEGVAWQRAREVVNDFRARYAAEQLRRTMTQTQRVLSDA